MNRLLGISLAAIALFPAAARANEITDASYELDGESAQVILRSKEPLNPPRLRIERGAVRMTFTGVSDQQWLAPSVDGEAIRAVAVYPGVGEGAVVRITLGDHRTLDSGSIRIAREGRETRVRIPRSKLPGATASRSEAPLADLKASSATRTPPQPVAEAPAAVPVKSAEKPADVKPLFTLPINTNDSRASSAIASSTSSKGSGIDTVKARDNTPVLLMLAASFGLLGVYALIRYGMGKRLPGDTLSNIEVVASKRLAPRHQLVVIRALGEDHLLSINAGRTERLASMPSPQTSERSTPRDEHEAFAGFFSRWQKTSASLQEKVDQRDIFEERDKLGTRATAGAAHGPELLHFGERKTGTHRTPLETLNLLDAKRTNGSANGGSTMFKLSQLRDRSQ
jgi:flagellar biogenesis protein FliO